MHGSRTDFVSLLYLLYYFGVDYVRAEFVPRIEQGCFKCSFVFVACCFPTVIGLCAVACCVWMRTPMRVSLCVWCACRAYLAGVFFSLCVPAVVAAVCVRATFVFPSEVAICGVVRVVSVCIPRSVTILFLKRSATAGKNVTGVLRGLASLMLPVWSSGGYMRVVHVNKFKLFGDLTKVGKWGWCRGRRVCFFSRRQARGAFS